MAIGDIKTFTITYDGLVLEIDAIDNGDGTTMFVVRCIEGYADINALYWNDGDDQADFDGFGKKDSSLNMNGTGEAWDGAHKLSSPGLGTAGTDKPTFLTAGETLNAFTLNVPWDDLDTIGVRATSTSTAEGSIKGVADEPVVTEAPDISVADADCVIEGGTATFTINLSHAYDYDITIHYETAGGTATEGADYTGKTGSVTIKAGETSATVEIETIDDDEVEENETFTLKLTSAQVNANVDDDPDIDLVLDLTANIIDNEGEGCIEDNDDDGGGGGGPGDPDDFPTWGQDISNIILVFDQDAGDSKPRPDGDGYYTVKIDNWPGSADDDLDNSIDAILAYLIANDTNISSDENLLGVVIKGGQQDTNFYAYGDNNTNGTDPDDAPADLGFSWEDNENPSPANAIDISYTYENIFS